MRRVLSLPPRHTALFAAVFGGAACSGSPTPSPGPVAQPDAAAQAASSSVVAPEASAAPGAGPPGAAPAGDGLTSIGKLPAYAGGRFELVASYSDFVPKEECLHMFPGFTELAATPRGAWIVGACGVRLRYLDAKLTYRS